MKARAGTDAGSRFARMLAALGSESRLRILRLLLRAHPNGMVVAELGGELGIAAPTLSHHLDKLRREELIAVKREGTFLRYSANTDALQGLLGFLFDECCTQNHVLEAKAVVCCPREERDENGNPGKRKGSLRAGSAAGARRKS